MTSRDLPTEIVEINRRLSAQPNSTQSNPTQSTEHRAAKAADRPDVELYYSGLVDTGEASKSLRHMARLIENNRHDRTAFTVLSYPHERKTVYVVVDHVDHASTSFRISLKDGTIDMDAGRAVSIL